MLRRVFDYYENMATRNRQYKFEKKKQDKEMIVHQQDKNLEIEKLEQKINEIKEKEIALLLADYNTNASEIAELDHLRQETIQRVEELKRVPLVLWINTNQYVFDNVMDSIQRKSVIVKINDGQADMEVLNIMTDKVLSYLKEYMEIEAEIADRMPKREKSKSEIKEEMIKIYDTFYRVAREFGEIGVDSLYEIGMKNFSDRKQHLLMSGTTAIYDLINEPFGRFDYASLIASNIGNGQIPKSKLKK